MPEDGPFVAVGGRRIEYCWIPAARAARPTLVFLHQGLGSVSLWRDVPQVLAARTGCAAFVYSRAGYGFSDPVAEPRRPDFMLAEGREVLPALLALRGIADPILVGHSDGGTVALAYLAAGHKARGAIVAAPHVVDEEITWRAIERQRAEWRDGALREALRRHHRDVDETFRSWAEIWLAPEFRNWSIAALLPSIRVPLLAIQGEDDSHGTMVQVDKIAQLAGGPVRVEKLSRCGHDPFRDRRERVLALCAAFIERL